MSSGSQPPNDKYVALAVKPQTTKMSLWHWKGSPLSAIFQLYHDDQAMNEVEIFGSFSGLLLIRNKTEGAWIGKLKKWKFNIAGNNRDHSPNFFRQTSLLFHKWLAERFNLDDAWIVNVRYKDTSIYNARITWIGKFCTFRLQAKLFSRLFFIL